MSKDIDGILDEIDFSKLGDNVAIKVHFGEKGCTTYVDPLLVKKVYDKIVSLGKKAVLVETNVLYKGERTRASSHIALAKEHGFDFAPIDILDGEMGDEFVSVDTGGGLANPVKIGGHISSYDSLVVISHFKGHIAAGFGGTLKNLGMGMGSRAGKLHMHASVNPSINIERCIGCGICAKHCDVDAISIVDKKAIINNDRCVGCAMCIGVCPHGAVQIPWGTSTNDELQKKIVDYAAGTLKLITNHVFINVMQKITPECDCMGKEQEPMMEDVGVLFSYDPVALDKACLDLADKESSGEFDKINSIDKNIQIDYAAERKLGSKEYDLRKV